MYAAARYTAYLCTGANISGAQMASRREEALAIFDDQFRQMFLDAGSRAILLNGNFNEIGIGFTNGILGGQPTMRAYALTNDLGASDELFITGGAFQPTILDVLSAPRPMTGIAVSSGDTATVTNEGGGYRIRREMESLFAR